LAALDGKAAAREILRTRWRATPRRSASAPARWISDILLEQVVRYFKPLPSD
jgi:hypothetical protein